MFLLKKEEKIMKYIILSVTENHVNVWRGV